MTSILDILQQIDEENYNNSVSIVEPIKTGSSRTIEDALREINNEYLQVSTENDNSLKNSELQQSIPEQTQPQDEESLQNGHLSGLARYGALTGIGAMDYAGQSALAVPSMILGNLGDMSESLNAKTYDMFSKMASQQGIPLDELAGFKPGLDSDATTGSKLLGEAHKFWSNIANDAERYVAGDNPSLIDRGFRGAGTGLGFAATSGLLGLGVQSLLKISPLWANVIGGAIGGTLEAGAESGTFLNEKYAEDKSRYKDALKVANYNYMANAPTDILLDAAGNIISPLIGGVPGILARFGWGFLGSLLKENAQEAKQKAIENASNRTYESGDVSFGNFFSNLIDETKKIPSYLWQQAPEVSLSTTISNTILGLLGLSTKSGRRHIVDRSLRDQIKIDKLNPNDPLLAPPEENRTRQYNAKKRQREELQNRINNAYASYGSDIDTDLDNLKEVQDMEAQLQNLDNEIETFWGDTGVVNNPVQDDDIDLFPDENDNNGNEETPPPATPPSAPTNGQTESPNAAQDSGLMPPISGLQDNQATPKTQPKRDLLPEEQQLTILDNNPLSPNNPDDNDLPPITALRTPNSETRPTNSQEQQPVTPSQSDTATLMPPITGLRNDNSTSTQATSLTQQNGNTARVRTMQGTEADVRYRVVEADDSRLTFTPVPRS